MEINVCANIFDYNTRNTQKAEEVFILGCWQLSCGWWRRHSSIKKKKSKRASFCQVSKIRSEDSWIPCVNTGSQKWNGESPKNKLERKLKWQLCLNTNRCLKVNLFILIYLLLPPQYSGVLHKKSYYLSHI